MSNQSKLGILICFFLNAILYFTHGHYNEPEIYFICILALGGSFTFLKSKKLNQSFSSIHKSELLLWFLTTLQLLLLIQSPTLLYIRNQNANENLNAFLKLSLFFWTLYNGLYFKLAQKNKNKNKNGIIQFIQNHFLGILGLICLILSKKYVIPASPAPSIDVHVWVTEAVDHLLNFKNPYSSPYSDLGTKQAYGYDPLFPYLPGLLYILAPFRALNLDIRYGLLFSDLITALLLSLLTYRKFPTSKRLPLAITFFWISLPESFFVLEQAWVDSFIITGAVGVLYSLLQKRIKQAALLAGIAATLKQYAIFYAFFALVDVFKSQFNTEHTSKQRLHKIALWISLGLGSFFLILLPFLWIDAQSLFNSTVVTPTAGLQSSQLRFDAMTLSAWAGWRRYETLLSWIGNPLFFTTPLIILYFVFFSKSNAKTKTIPSGFLFLSCSFFFFSFFYLFGRHAFCNQYYFLSIWPLLLALI